MYIYMHIIAHTYAHPCKFTHMLQVFLEARSLAPVKFVDFLAVAMVGFSWMDYLMMFYIVICVVRDASHAFMVIIKMSLKTFYQHTPAGASTTSTPSTATMTSTPVARAMGASEIPSDNIQFVYQLTTAHKASFDPAFWFCT